MKKNHSKTFNSADTEVLSILKNMIGWAYDCGEILNYYLHESYKKPLKIIDKGKQGVATEADIQSELYVMSRIKELYPGHSILSEEDSFSKKLNIHKLRADDYLWLIDPLDGTNNFFNKVPFFCVSLALLKGQQTIAAVVYNPVNFELFYATKNGGAFFLRRLGGKEIHIRLRKKKTIKGFKEALLSANLTSKRIEKDLLKEFPEVRAMRRFGSAALEMCYVAAGMLDAYWEYRLKPWDMAAAGLICEEAGVKISTIDREKFHPFCSSVVCADQSLYLPLISILNRK